MLRILAAAVAAALVCAGGFVAQAQNTSNYIERGGATWHVAGDLQVDSGGVLDVESGASLKIAGTAVTASAAELNAADISAAGTVTASKAVVVDSNKDIGDFRNLDAVNFDAGASAVAGSVDVFPTTASKGKLSITAGDSAGDTTTTIVNASQAGTRTYTIPDAGASASFAMSEGAQTLNGVKTFGSGVAFAAGATFDADSGAATANIGNSYAVTVSKMAGVITTDSLTTAAGSAQAIVVTSAGVAAGDIVLITRNGGTSAGGTPVIKAVPTTNTITITIDNKHASAAFDGTYVLGFLVIKA